MEPFYLRLTKFLSTGGSGVSGQNVQRPTRCKYERVAVAESAPVVAVNEEPVAVEEDNQSVQRVTGTLQRIRHEELEGRKVIRTIVTLVQAGTRPGKIREILKADSLPELIALFKYLPLSSSRPIPTESFEGDKRSRHRYIYKKIKSAQNQGLSSEAVAFKLATYVTHELLIETIAFAALGRLYVVQTNYEG